MHRIVQEGLHEGATIPEVKLSGDVAAMFPLYIHLHREWERRADEREQLIASISAKAQADGKEQVPKDKELPLLPRYSLFPRIDLSGCPMVSSKDDLLTLALARCCDLSLLEQTLALARSHQEAELEQMLRISDNALLLRLKEALEAVQRKIIEVSKDQRLDKFAKLLMAL